MANKATNNLVATFIWFDAHTTIVCQMDIFV